MSFPGFALGHQLGEENLARRHQAEDEQRQAQLQNIATAGLSPEQQRDAIQQLYAKDPSALKRHVENLFGRLVGRKPQPVASQPAPLTLPAETEESSLSMMGRPWLNTYSNPEDQPPSVSYGLNKTWSRPGPYTTHLSPQEERQFQQWVTENRIPWRDSPTADYDMRGYWKALINPNDPNHSLTGRVQNGAFKGHFSDKWKTPYSGVFSRESMYATPNAPYWDGDRLVTADGRVVTDETPGSMNIPPARRLTLPAPAPVTVNYPGAKTHAERLAQDLSGGKTKEQQTLDLFNQEGAAGLASKQRALKWIQSLPADQQHTASELLGISQRPNFKNFRNTKTGETITWDANQGTPGPDWVLSGTSSGAVRSLGYGISAADAIKAMQATGQKYAKPDGSFYTPQELAALSPNMQLRAFAVGGQVYYGVANQTEHTVTFGNQVYRMDQFGNVDTAQPLGVARVPTAHSSASTDPFGVTTTTTSTTTPVTPGANPASVPLSTPNAAPAPRRVVSHHAGASRTHAPSAPRVLDASGHIPADAGNPYLVQAANSLLDGMDVNKIPIPPKDRTAAMKLAEEYGYKGQGLFTPRESLQLREGANVIQNMLNSDALNVLDKGTIANLPMLGQSADPSKAGLWGRLTTSLASKAATPQQQEFMRYWRQLDALAIGLRSLVQTGRATQTQVDRLIAELPNPYNTTSAADARNRLRLVQNELRIAAESGKLPDVPLGSGPTRKTSGDSAVDTFLRSFPHASAK